MNNEYDYIKCSDVSLRQMVSTWKQSYDQARAEHAISLVDNEMKRIEVDPQQLPGKCSFGNGRVLLQPVFVPMPISGKNYKVELLDSMFIKLYCFQDAKLRIKCPPCMEQYDKMESMLCLANICDKRYVFSRQDAFKLNMLDVCAGTIALQLNVSPDAETIVFEWLTRNACKTKFMIVGNSGWLKSARRKYMNDLPVVKRVLAAFGVGMPKIKVIKGSIID